MSQSTNLVFNGGSIPGTRGQSDWSENNPHAPSYIKNKPNIDNGRIHRLRPISDEVIGETSNYGGWVLDLESQNESAPGGYDRLTPQRLKQILDNGEFLVMEVLQSGDYIPLALQALVDVQNENPLRIKVEFVSQCTYNNLLGFLRMAMYTPTGEESYIQMLGIGRNSSWYQDEEALAINGDGDDVTVDFTEAQTRTNIGTGEKLSVLFGKIKKWFTDLKALAFKDKADLTQDVSGVLPIANGGTNANTTSGARANLDVYSKSEVDNALPQATSTTPSMDGTASVGSETRWAKGDHVHPTDTSREAASNKAQVVIDSSTTDYPSSKAVADFVNSSIATNTANFLGTYDVVNDLGLSTSATNAQIATALGSYAFSTSPTNNDYVFASIDLYANTGDNEYRRFKFNGTAWAYEYTLNNSSFTAAQWDAINSGITSSDKLAYDNAVALLTSHTADTNIHVTAADRTNWNAKADNTPVFAQASSRTNIEGSGETMPTILGKIKKWFTDLGTAAFKNAPSSGNASTEEVVLGSDTRLNDARTPTSHTHDDRYYTETEVNSMMTGKANDADVVHKAGDETITGVKTFSNAVTPVQTYNNTTTHSRIFSLTELNVIKEYSTWTEEEKDGNHYRQWAIDITSAVTANSAGRFTVTIQGSYYSASSYGTLQKVITFRLVNNAVSYNQEDYMIAQSPCADEFVISGVVKIGNNFYIIIANKVPANNNYPVSLRIDYIANASVVLNSVTCTGEIVLGWPYWAGDIDTPVKVTASGRTVLTRADVADIDVVSTTIRKTLTSTDISNGYVEFTLDANTPFTSLSGFNSIVNSHLYMETIRIMTTADLGNYDAVGFLIIHTDAASGGGSLASSYIAGATMSRCSSTSIITGSYASLCMPVVTQANLGSITIRVGFVRATMSAGVTLTIDYDATIVR